jgi:hypothetical protein
MKKCRGCKEEKPLDQFGNNKSQKDGKHWNCKTCAKAAIKASRMRRKEREKAKAAEQREVHLQGLKPQERAYADQLLDVPSVSPAQEEERTYTVQTCERYVRQLHRQKLWQGLAFHPMTQSTLDKWEERLAVLIGEDGLKRFKKEHGII